MAFHILCPELVYLTTFFCKGIWQGKCVSFSAYLVEERILGMVFEVAELQYVTQCLCFVPFSRTLPLLCDWAKTVPHSLWCSAAHRDVVAVACAHVTPVLVTVGMGNSMLWNSLSNAALLYWLHHDLPSFLVLKLERTCKQVFKKLCSDVLPSISC